MSKFEFTELAEHGFSTLNDKEKGSLILEKWGLGAMKVRTFSFTGQLPTVFDPTDFLMQFFTTKGVSMFGVESIEYETLTTNVTGRTYWKKLWSGPTKLVRDVPNHPIQKCMDKKINSIWVSDLLQTALVDDESEEYEVFTENDRKELIFYIMKALVLGGEICQYEDNWDTYEPIVISLYRDVVGQSVVKNTSGAVSIVARSFLIKKVNDTEVCTDERSFYLVVVDTIGKKVRVMNFMASI
ncbi:hypothetical protein TRFO_27687 [Tritrichomonas foetus]|uniref:Cilia- and flagella-associated protein 300 n=1 Tax=Tritrichomonas foetus TaxID=1144522 RepID=A0A1J4K158_9EUKA|nr:hypothetical protein TRFO_27687 [Tritrichomonas foetus]|eukprot:OHT04690.1 hypothetical protein TRFO_27687 [Tritrichomonas foetus]